MSSPCREADKDTSSLLGTQLRSDVMDHHHAVHGSDARRYTRESDYSGEYETEFVGP